VSTNPNAYHVDNGTHFAAGDRVSYACAPGYSHTGGKIYQTCTRRVWTWSPLEIQCERKNISKFKGAICKNHELLLIADPDGQ